MLTCNMYYEFYEANIVVVACKKYFIQSWVYLKLLPRNNKKYLEYK